MIHIEKEARFQFIAFTVMAIITILLALYMSSVCLEAKDVCAECNCSSMEIERETLLELPQRELGINLSTSLQTK